MVTSIPWLVSTTIYGGIGNYLGCIFIFYKYIVNENILFELSDLKNTQSSIFNFVSGL